MAPGWLHNYYCNATALSDPEAGLGTEYVRAPRLTLIGEERERVLGIIRKGLATRPVLPEYLSLAV